MLQHYHQIRKEYNRPFISCGTFRAKALKRLALLTFNLLTSKSVMS